MNGTELLAPAGALDTAFAAFDAGADAVYAGLDAFSARASAVNLSADGLSLLMRVAKARGKKVYVTFNTLVSDAELPEAAEKLAILEELAPHALIVQDLGVARIVRKNFPSLALHASTQLAAHNLEGVLALKELGFSRVVLARELPVEDIRSITKRCGCEIEVFVHGALCYSISGLCLFSAMEMRRSGNRGRCAYCCRLAYTDASGARSFPFSMKDLRLDDRLEALQDAGVSSLKIEGRMKSALYVASAVSRYRDLLDGKAPAVSREDLETVFSRATTRLYADGWRGDPGGAIDPVSLGHRGAHAGFAKRITKDRDGRSWLRFHTSRAIEKHDGLQFTASGAQTVADDGRALGTGIGEMRLAISRKPAFHAPAGSDVEIEITPLLAEQIASMGPISSVEVRCSMSNAVKRRFPPPSCRESDYPGTCDIDVSVEISADGVKAASRGESATLPLPSVQKALHPEKTAETVRKCFAKLGGTIWSLGSLSISDPAGLFVPASLLNELRRNLVASLDRAREARRSEKIHSVKAWMESDAAACGGSLRAMRTVKVRLGQPVPPGDWDEVVVAVGHAGEVAGLGPETRLSIPVFTREGDFSRLRGRVKSLLRAGYSKWEAADLAGLRMLKSCGIEDLTADWTLYAFNSQAALALAELGVKRCVASPESDDGADDAKRAIPMERLIQQSTPLFISVTRPAAKDVSRLENPSGIEFTSFELDGLWITTRPVPRTFKAPPGASTRIDLSWDPIG